MTRRFALLVALPLLASPAGAQAAAPFDPFRQATIEAPVGARAPLDMPLQDEFGRAVTLRGLAGGRPIVLAPVLHNCPNICGVTLGSLADAVAERARARGDDIAVVALGIDPRETPADARTGKAALAAREAGVPIHALTGGEAAIKAVTDALGYRYAYDPEIGQYAHVAALAVLAPDGRLARWLYGLAPEATALDEAVAEAREGRIGSLGERLLLLCYRYDPRTGRYTLLIDRVLQVAGIAVVLALAGFVVLSLLKERKAGGAEG
jgi:protein SCO1/2